MSTPPLTSMLSDENLALLRLGFDGQVAYAMALGSLSAPVPGAAPWVEASGAYFFKDAAHMSAQRRELCVLSVLTSLRAPDQLAIHVYWGLMVGLSVTQVGDAIFLGADYAGIACFDTGLKVAKAALSNLETQASAAAPKIDAQLAALNTTDTATLEAARLAACRSLLSVPVVVPALAGAVSRSLAGVAG